MLDAKWNTETGHLKKCIPHSRKMVCITKNEDGSACHNCHRLSLQSCNYGNGVYCAIHHKKNINFGHDPNLSSCANVRCDELKIDYEDRKKIHQYNIDEILCLPGHDIYCHVSKSRQRIFNWNVIPEIDRYSQSVEASNTEETNSESESDNDFVNPDSDSTESDESTSKEGEEESSSEPILLKIEIDLTNNNRKRKHVQINLQPMKKSSLNINMGQKIGHKILNVNDGTAYIEETMLFRKDR